MDSNFENVFPVSSGSVDVAGHELHYLKIGTGNKLVLAFNGYGNESSVFQFLQHPDFTVLSFDLPYHGNSIGNNEESLLKKCDFEKLAKDLMHEYHTHKIGLVGFSLGARVCICIAELLPDHIRNMVLVAPDGLQPNHFYRFLTATQLGRSLFRGFVRFGDRYIQLFAALHKIGILSRYKYKFAIQYIRTASSRQLLYDIWLSTSQLIPHLHHIKRQISAHHIPVHIMMGQNDKIIPIKNALRFKGRSTYINVHVFERGHNLLDFEEVRGTVLAWLFRINHSAKHL
jgi:pimeloyl-ACP methyl ester carboxylesterase